MTHKYRRAIAAVGLLISFVGCDVDPSVAPSMSAVDTLFWTLRINYPAVRLSLSPPYDTVSLSAIPYSAVGASIDTTDIEHAKTTWYSTDSTLVRVTSTGVVSAHGVTGTKKIYVVANKQVEGITREDRALIQVVDLAMPPVLGSFQARPTDSLKRAAGTTFIMTPRFFDRDSVPLTGLPVHYRSSNRIAVNVSDPWGSVFSAGSLLQTNGIGTSHVVASTMAFGVALVDTFTLEVGYPIEAFSVPMPDIKSVKGVATSYLLYASIDIGPNGVVSFTNGTGVNAQKAATNPGLTPSNGTVVNYIFDDSLSIKDAGSRYTPTADGNIFAISGDTLTPSRNKRHFRRFPQPGRYEYTVEPYGFRGVVVVHDR